MAEEKRLDNKVLAHLKSIGAWRLKYWAGSAYTKNGVPDILACINGYFFGIEDKATNGKPLLLQLKNLEWIRQAGGYGILLYPCDFDNFKKFTAHPDKTDLWYRQNIMLQNQWKNKLEKI